MNTNIGDVIKNNSKTLLLYLLFFIFWIVVGQFVPGFKTLGHFAYILQLAGLLGIVAAGQTLAFLIAGIDLSVGMVITFGGILTTLILATTQGNLVVAIILALIICSLIGTFNGFGISIIGIPPIVMTLATSSIITGIALILTNGTPHAANHQGLENWVNNGWFFGMNGVVFIWVIVTIAMTLLLHKTSLGKKIYYLGSSPLSTTYAGHNPHRIAIFVYTISGLLSGVTGILLVGFTGRSYFGMGNTYLFLSLAAVVVGGTSLLGGKGNYFGTIAGVLLLTMISSVLILFKISYGGQLALQGLIILALVIVYSLEFKRKN